MPQWCREFCCLQSVKCVVVPCRWYAIAPQTGALVLYVSVCCLSGRPLLSAPEIPNSFFVDLLSSTSQGLYPVQAALSATSLLHGTIFQHPCKCDKQFWNHQRILLTSLLLGWYSPAWPVVGSPVGLFRFLGFAQNIAFWVQMSAIGQKSTSPVHSARY